MQIQRKVTVSQKSQITPRRFACDRRVGNNLKAVEPAIAMLLGSSALPQAPWADWCCSLGLHCSADSSHKLSIHRWGGRPAHHSASVFPLWALQKTYSFYPDAAWNIICFITLSRHTEMTPSTWRQIYLTCALTGNQLSLRMSGPDLWWAGAYMG